MVFSASQGGLAVPRRIGAQPCRKLYCWGSGSIRGNDGATATDRLVNTLWRTVSQIPRIFLKEIIGAKRTINRGSVPFAIARSGAVGYICEGQELLPGQVSLFRFGVGTYVFSGAVESGLQAERSGTQYGSVKMQVHGPGHIHGAQPLSGPHLSRTHQLGSVQENTAIRDEVQISELGQLLGKVHELPDIRADLVAKIRAEIAAGTYETEEKLKIAIDRLLDEIG